MFNQTLSENKEPVRDKKKGGLLHYWGVFWQADTFDNNNGKILYFLLSI